MRSKSIKFRVALIAPMKCTSVRFILYVNVHMAAQVGLANESFLTVRAAIGLIVGLSYNLIKLIFK